MNLLSISNLFYYSLLIGFVVGIINFYKLNSFLNYLKNHHPEKFKELGNLTAVLTTWDGQMKLLKIIFSKDDPGEEELSKMLKPIKIYTTIGLSLVFITIILRILSI